MAKIKGVHVTDHKEHETMDGVAYVGKLWMDGRKIGVYENSGRGGGTLIHFENKDARDEFRRRVEQYYKECPATLNDEESFILELLDLIEAEKLFQKHSKKWGKAIVVRSYSNRRTDPIESWSLNSEQDALYAVGSEDGLKKLLDEIKPVAYSVYRSLDDFNEA